MHAGSPSSQRAWIEIEQRDLCRRKPKWSPSSQRAWIEIAGAVTCGMLYSVSPSSQRAWIEINTPYYYDYNKLVALLAEGVDRNVCHIGLVYLVKRSPSSQRAWIEIALVMIYESRNAVALLAEGVDRNTWLLLGLVALYVALLAEGVDRNPQDTARDIKIIKSPSSQRAWIEIAACRLKAASPPRRPPRRGRG